MSYILDNIKNNRNSLSIISTVQLIDILFILTWIDSYDDKTIENNDKSRLIPLFVIIIIFNTVLFYFWCFIIIKIISKNIEDNEEEQLPAYSTEDPPIYDNLSIIIQEPSKVFI